MGRSNTFPKFLLFIDIAWLCIWFGAMVWFETTSPDLASYRAQTRLVFRHIVCTLALIYYISNPKSTIRTLGLIPFLYALLDDLVNLLDVARRLDQTESMVAWNVCAALSSIALSVSALAILWFLYHLYHIKKNNAL